MLTIVARLERLPFSRFHRRLLLMGGLGYMFDAMDQAIMAFILPVVSKIWHLTSVQTGGLGSATYIGFFCGAVSAGFAADRWGRKPIMMIALAIYAIFSAVSALVSDWYLFFGLRIAAGYGTGAESVVVAPFLAEFVASRYRGRFTGALAGFFSFGFFGAALIGVWVVPAFTTGWRIAIGLTALPIVLLLRWRRALPESPRWLESNGKHAEAVRIVAAMERDSGIAEEETINLSGDTAFVAPPSRDTEKRGLQSLLLAGQRRATIMSWILWFTLSWTYYAFFTWLPSLLVYSGTSIQSSFAQSLLIYSAQIPGYFVVAALIDRIGRKRVLALCLGGGGLAALAFGRADGVIMVNLCGLLLSFLMNGAYAGLYVYTPELFPTSARATGQGLASGIGRLGAIASPVLVGYILPHGGIQGVFMMLGCMLIVGAISISVLGVETTGQLLRDKDAIEPVSMRSSQPHSEDHAT